MGWYCFWNYFCHCFSVLKQAAYLQSNLRSDLLASLRIPTWEWLTFTKLGTEGTRHNGTAWEPQGKIERAESSHPSKLPFYGWRWCCVQRERAWPKSTQLMNSRATARVGAASFLPPPEPWAIFQIQHWCHRVIVDIFTSLFPLSPLSDQRGQSPLLKATKLQFVVLPGLISLGPSLPPWGSCSKSFWNEKPSSLGNFLSLFPWCHWWLTCQDQESLRRQEVCPWGIT